MQDLLTEMPSVTRQQQRLRSGLGRVDKGHRKPGEMNKEKFGAGRALTGDDELALSVCDLLQEEPEKRWCLFSCTFRAKTSQNPWKTGDKSLH